MKKIGTVVLAMMLSIVLLTGCGAPEEGNTIGTKLCSMFMDEIADNHDIENVAEKLSKHEVLANQNMVTMPVSEGYLNGFDAEIKGFKKGVMFSPMIGSIPFVGYVFETDNPDALVQTLKDHAQLNWNICTVADEMVVETKDNYVFFVMAPNSFE